MKAFTDLEQSEKLAEFLPLESADMIYTTFYGKLTKSLPMPKEAYDIVNFSIPGDKCVPCWSLATLLSIIRKTIGYEVLCLDRKNITLKCELGDEPWSIEIKKDNEVDACYEMIIKLKENNLI